MSVMTTTFQPPRWLRSPHLQTIAAAAPLFSPPRSHVVTDDEAMRFRIPAQGKALEGHVHARAWWVQGRAPAVVILHGIAGSKESHCCVRASVALHRAGYHTVRIDMRGAGDSVVDAPSLYHAGLTSDLDQVVRQLSEDPRVSGILVLGFSGGGSIALKLAGEWGEAVPESVLGIATISAPLDYTRVAPRMDKLECWPYRYHVLGGLLDRARAFADQHPTRSHYRARSLARIRRFRDYDAAVIVPMHGFSSVDSYYEQASSGPYVSRIEVPTLVVHAEDDPMVPVDTLHPWLDGASPSVEARLSRYGGHIGWLGGIDELSWINGWATSQALAFFEERVVAVREGRTRRAVRRALGVA
jgi:predicted alpha/beta-fold hydrolase